MKILVFAAAIGLLSAHQTWLCSSTDAQWTGKVTFFMGTYHGTPGDGGVPGFFHIQAPGGGTAFKYKFDNFRRPCGTAGTTHYPAVSTAPSNQQSCGAGICANQIGKGGGNNKITMDMMKNHLIATFNSPSVHGFGVTASSVVNCWSGSGKKINGVEVAKQVKYYLTGFGPTATSCPSLSSTQVTVDKDSSCMPGNSLQAWYFAQLTNVQPGDYQMWTTATDINLAPFTSGDSACQLGKNVYDPTTQQSAPMRLQIPISAALGGNDCPAGSFATAVAALGGGFGTSTSLINADIFSYGGTYSSNTLAFGTTTILQNPMNCNAKVISGYNCAFRCYSSGDSKYDSQTSSTSYVKTGTWVCRGGIWTGTGAASPYSTTAQKGLLGRCSGIPTRAPTASPVAPCTNAQASLPRCQPTVPPTRAPTLQKLNMFIDVGEATSYPGTTYMRDGDKVKYRTSAQIDRVKSSSTAPADTFGTGYIVGHVTSSATSIKIAPESCTATARANGCNGVVGGVTTSNGCSCATISVGDKAPGHCVTTTRECRGFTTATTTQASGASTSSKVNSPTAELAWGTNVGGVNLAKKAATNGDGSISSTTSAYGATDDARGGSGSSCKSGGVAATTGKTVVVTETATSTALTNTLTATTCPNNPTSNGGQTKKAGTLACKVTTRQCRYKYKAASANAWTSTAWVAAATGGDGTVVLDTADPYATSYSGSASCKKCSVVHATNIPSTTTAWAICETEVQTASVVIKEGACATSGLAAGTTHTVTAMAGKGWNSQTQTNQYKNWVQKLGKPDYRLGTNDNCVAERAACLNETTTCKLAFEAVLKGKYEDPGTNSISASTIALRAAQSNGMLGEKCYKKVMCTSSQRWNCYDVFVYTKCLEANMEAFQNLTNTGYYTAITNPSPNYNARANHLFSVSPGETHKLPALLSCMGAVTNIRFHNFTAAGMTIEKEITSGWTLKWWWFLIIGPICVCIGWLEQIYLKAYYKEKWHVMDADKDGVVSAEERHAYILNLGLSPACVAKIDEEFAKQDHDGDGIVSREEARAGAKSGIEMNDVENQNIPSPPASPRTD